MKAILLSVSAALGALLVGILIGRGSVARPPEQPSKVTNDSPAKTIAELAPPSKTNSPSFIPQPSENAAKKSPKVDIVTGLKEALAHSGSRHTLTTLSNLVDSADATNIANIAAFAQSLTKPQDKNLVLPLVLGRWAELNP